MNRKAFPAQPQVPISRSIRAGDFIFTSAYGPWVFDPRDVKFDDNGNPLTDGSDLESMLFAEQVHKTFAHIVEALKVAGATLEHVVDSQCWLSDPRDFVKFNEIYGTYFIAEPPVRSVFKGDFMFCCKVEIKVIAYLPMKG